MKRIILIIMTMILIMSCGGKKGLSEESRKRIEEEISKINDNMSDMELENMMTTAKLNYDVNPEVGVMYFEKLSKYSPEASRYVAEYYYDKKDYENFEKWIKKSAEGGFLPGMYNLAWYYGKTERYAEAEKWYLKYLEKNPDNVDAIKNLGIVYGKEGKYEEAEKYFKKAGIEGSGIYNTALVYKTEKKYDKAEKIYLEAIEKGDIEAYFGLGDMYDKLKKKKKAEEVYIKGAEKGEYRCAFIMGGKYFDYGNFKEAAKFYLIAAEKGDEEAMFNLGLTYKILKNYSEARKWFQKAAERGDEKAKEYLKKLEGK